MKTLDKPFRDLTQAVFARYGFAYGELLSQWASIVGQATAQAYKPERISWPRQAGEARQRLGGTLVVRAAPGRGLELQYEIPRLIERINAFYGYGAITAIKIRQVSILSPRPATRPRPVLGAAQAAALETELESITDENLRAALRRLGTGSLAGPLNSQQDQ
jgi:hypothetical protein